MDEEPAPGPAAGEGSPPSPEASGSTHLPDPTDPLVVAQAELRQAIDAGAGSPEELRALAARIREHKAQEESRWRAEVRPVLMESKKGAFRLGELRRRPAREERSDGTGWGIGVAIGLVMVALVLLATQTSLLLILVPALGVLVYAYVQGRQAQSPPPDPPVDPAP